jgi:hypothetical protein
MIWLLLALGTIAVIELFGLLPVKRASAEMLSIARKSAKTIAAKHVSDRWKEVALRVYAIRLLFSSLSLFVFLAVAISPMLIIAIVCAVLRVEFFAVIVTPLGLVASTLVAVAYLCLRKQVLHGTL